GGCGGAGGEGGETGGAQVVGRSGGAGGGGRGGPGHAGADVLAGLLDEPVGIQGRHAAGGQVDVGGRVGARACPEQQAGGQVEKLGGAAGVAQRGRQVPGAGQPAPPRAR